MSLRFRDGVTPDIPGKTGLLLVNLGTPDAPTARAVWRYLAEFLHDYRVVDTPRWLWCPLLHGIILPVRSGKVARNYARVWTDKGSPLLALSRDLAHEVQAQLPEFDVRLAMRYGSPSIAKVLQQFQANGLERLVVLPLYPQYSAATTASALDGVMAELSGWRRVPSLRFISDYHDDADWLTAMAASVRNHWQANGRGDRLLMSFHGLPQRFVAAGDPYARHCETSARLLAGRLGLGAEDWQITYQSRFGREPWLLPATDKTLQALARSGLTKVDVICPGFAVDCLETLEEIKLLNAELFRHAGGSELRYISALNADTSHATALASIAKRHALGWQAGA